MKARPMEVAFIALLALLALGAARLHPPQPFVINETSSVPRGLYLRQASTRLTRGALVDVEPPAAARTYLTSQGGPARPLLLKRVAALPGDLVCSDGNRVLTPMGEVVRRPTDRHGERLPQWSGCGPLAPGAVFVLGDSALSFDSRYYGPVPMTSVGHRLEAILTW